MTRHQIAHTGSARFRVAAIAVAIACTTPAAHAQMASYYNQLVNTVQQVVINKVLAAMGLGVEGAVTESNAALQGEILKGTAAKKAAAEALASYRIEQQMRREAMDVRESLRSPSLTCDTIAAQTGIASARTTVQARALNTQRSIVERLASPTSVGSRIEQQHQATNAAYCTQAEVARGICSNSAGPLAGADQTAAFLFQGADKSLTFTPGQDAAATSYINRIAAYAPTEHLQGNDYARNPRSRAFIELRRRFESVASMVSYSLSQVASSQGAVAGLGDATRTSDVAGFAAKRDMSMSEAVQRFIAKKFSPASIQDAITATKEETILRDIAQTQSFQLWLDQQTLNQDARTEALMALQLALLTEQTMRPAIDQQRRMASEALAKRK